MDGDIIAEIGAIWYFLGAATLIYMFCDMTGTGNLKEQSRLGKIISFFLCGIAPFFATPIIAVLLMKKFVKEIKKYAAD